MKSSTFLLLSCALVLVSGQYHYRIQETPSLRTYRNAPTYYPPSLRNSRNVPAFSPSANIHRLTSAYKAKPFTAFKTYKNPQVSSAPLRTAIIQKPEVAIPIPFAPVSSPPTKTTIIQKPLVSTFNTNINVPVSSSPKRPANIQKSLVSSFNANINVPVSSPPVRKATIQNPQDSTFKLLSGPSEIFLRSKASFYAPQATAGNDVVSQTKAQAKGLIDVLRLFAADPKAVKFVREISVESSCIKSLDDAISATQAASDLIERSGSELNKLLNTYNSLKEEKDTVALMKGSATMMVILDTLIPELADFPLSTQCRGRPNAALEGLQEVTNLMNKMAKNSEYTLAARSYLGRSASIMQAYTTFTTNFRDEFRKFPEHCSSDSDVNAAAIGAIGELFDEITTLVNALGSNFDLSGVKQKNINYATQLVDTMEKLRKLDIVFLPCNNVLSWRKMGEELLEIADLVEEIGTEALSEQLGIDFNLQF